MANVWARCNVDADVAIVMVLVRAAGWTTTAATSVVITTDSATAWVHCTKAGVIAAEVVWKAALGRWADGLAAAAAAATVAVSATLTLWTFSSVMRNVVTATTTISYARHSRGTMRYVAGLKDSAAAAEDDVENMAWAITVVV